MTRDDSVQHWKVGARKELHAAELLCEGGEYEAVLFHCHLAAEKALKSLWIAKWENEPPHVHDLLELIHEMDMKLTKETLALCMELNQFAVEARYADPVFATHSATESRARDYLERTQRLLFTLLP